MQSKLSRSNAAILTLQASQNVVAGQLLNQDELGTVRPSSPNLPLSQLVNTNTGWKLLANGAQSFLGISSSLDISVWNNQFLTFSNGNLLSLHVSGYNAGYSGQPGYTIMSPDASVRVADGVYINSAATQDTLGNSFISTLYEAIALTNDKAAVMWNNNSAYEVKLAVITSTGSYLTQNTANTVAPVQGPPGSYLGYTGSIFTRRTYSFMTPMANGQFAIGFPHSLGKFTTYVFDDKLNYISGNNSFNFPSMPSVNAASGVSAITTANNNVVYTVGWWQNTTSTANQVPTTVRFTPQMNFVGSYSHSDVNPNYRDGFGDSKRTAIIELSSGSIAVWQNKRSSIANLVQIDILTANCSSLVNSATLIAANTIGNSLQPGALLPFSNGTFATQYVDDNNQVRTVLYDNLGNLLKTVTFQASQNVAGNTYTLTTSNAYGTNAPKLTHKMFLTAAGDIACFLHNYSNTLPGFHWMWKHYANLDYMTSPGIGPLAGNSANLYGITSLAVSPDGARAYVRYANPVQFQSNATYSMISLNKSYPIGVAQATVNAGSIVSVLKAGNFTLSVNTASGTGSFEDGTSFTVSSNNAYRSLDPATAVKRNIM